LLVRFRNEGLCQILSLFWIFSAAAHIAFLESWHAGAGRSYPGDTTDYFHVYSASRGSAAGTGRRVQRHGARGEDTGVLRRNCEGDYSKVHLGRARAEVEFGVVLDATRPQWRPCAVSNPLHGRNTVE
jgi:hypothetical protein